MLTGGCFCGSVRYAVTGTPFNATNCHCSICRRTTGAPFVAWFSVPLEEFRSTQGEPQRFHSTPDGLRSFCGRCGSQLTFQHAGRDEIDVTTCSLDHPETIPPRDNTHTSSRLDWVGADGRADFPKSRSD